MTSQITKDFKMKSRLRALADGGSPRPEMLGTGAAARAGGLLAGRGRQIDDAVDAATGAPAPAPAPAPVPAPQQVAQAPKKSGLRSMLGLADGGSPQRRPFEPVVGTRSPLPSGGGGGLSREAVAAAMNPPAPPPPAPSGVGALPADPLRNPRAIRAARERAAGLADGGSYLDAGYNANRYQQSQLRDGGRVNGPGGRTDDKVGPVMLSDEEYVLPGDTADAIGRDKLDAIRLATHEFKDERKESALRGRADGGDGWYDDMMPMDHLADGGNPWIVDGAGNVRKPNAFGDAAAGQGYTQPRQLPPPTPGTAVVPAQPPVGQRPPVNMGMVDEVPRQSPLRPAATAAAPQGRAYQVGKAVGGAAYTAGRLGGGLAVTAPVAGFGDYKADTGGVDTSASGTLGYLAKGQFGDAGTSLSGGLGEALADSGRGVAKTADAIAGLVGANPNLTGKYDGMISDKFGGYLSLRNPEIAGPPASAASKPPSPVDAAASALRSDQGPAQPVTPDSYQSRRLSEMGVPLDVQNSKPVVDSALRGTQGILKTGGTSQFQNLGTYGGNANIYGRSSDPSRPGRVNEFVGVGAGASPANEASGNGTGGSAVRSALRGYGGETAQPAPQSTQPVANQRSAAADAINARYDRLLKGGRGKAVEFGSDWSQRHGIALEKARGDELSSVLNNENTNATSRANAQLNAETLRSNAELSARTQMTEALSRMEQNRATISSQTQAAQIKALQDAQKYSDERQDKGAARSDALIEGAFTTTGKDGEKVTDYATMNQFQEYLGSGKVMHKGRPYMSLNPQERAEALPDVLNSFRVNKAMNEGGGLIGGGRTSNSPSPLRVREAEVGDLVNGLGVGEYLGSKFVPGYDADVVERTADRKVRSVEQVAGDDLERRKAILRNLATGN